MMEDLDVQVMNHSLNSKVVNKKKIDEVYNIFY